MGATPPQQLGHGSNGLDDAASKPKRARTSKPKVKTGCRPCKDRRIKCDEGRPACNNCIRSKKECYGYPPPPRIPGLTDEIRIAPKPLAPASSATGLPIPVREIQLPPRRASKYNHRRAVALLTPSTPNPLALAPLARAPRLNYSPSLTLPFTDQEAQYFHLFRSHTASELSGFFDSGFWTRSVLQECHSTTAIRHAVIALGALYKTLEKTNESPPGSPSPDSWVANPADTAQRHWEMAIRQYSHAINALVKADAAATTSHRTSLMASVLLACFDSFVGDHKQAIRQIQTGLRLLEQLRAEQRRQGSGASTAEPVEEELTQMFTRLAIQAKSYDMAFHFPDPYVVRLTSSHAAPTQQDPASPESERGGSPAPSGPCYSAGSGDTIPDRFSSVMEARVAWDRLLERMFRFTETLFARAQHGVMGVLPASLRQHGASFKRDIEAWSRAFDPILASRTAPGVSSQEKAAIAVLKMFQMMAFILLLMTFSDSEMHFDNFNGLFRKIVELAQEVVGDEEQRAKAMRCPTRELCRHQSRCQPPPRQHQHSFHQHQQPQQTPPLMDTDFSIYDDPLSTDARHIKPSFSADLGIVPPLYVVATKCRDPVLRRQAIRLLRSSARREGMWDSELTARIAMWIAEVEEEGVFPPSHGPNVQADFAGFGSPTGGDLFAQQQACTAAAATIPTPVASPVTNPIHTINDSIPTSQYQAHLLEQQLRQFHQQQQRPQAASRITPAPTMPTAMPVIPEEKRVMVRAVEFDLRERTAVIQLGSRNVKTGTPDLKTRVARIAW